MYSIERLPTVIEIGYSGEKNFRTVEIDMSEWMKTMPDGVPSIVYVRPGDSTEDAYIVATTFENNVLTWIVSDSDVGAHEGTGAMQIWLQKVNDDDEVIKRGKSAMVAIRVNEALNDPNSEPPPAQTSWLEQMAALTATTVSASATAQAAKDEAIDAAAAAESAAGMIIAQGGALKFYINDSGWLVMAFTDGTPIVEV